MLTTTHAPELGVIEGISVVLEASGLKPQDIAVFIHGTTLATNALIERKGAKTAFITTRRLPRHHRAGLREALRPL